VADVAKDFSSEIVDGGKNASRDDLPLDFGEPDFDLVKPGRVSDFIEVVAHGDSFYVTVSQSRHPRRCRGLSSDHATTGEAEGSAAIRTF
jgi:hypothetical protein